MEPRSGEQGASRAREAEGKVKDQEKDHREGQGQKEDNGQDDEEEIDPGSLS